MRIRSFPILAALLACGLAGNCQPGNSQTVDFGEPTIATLSASRMGPSSDQTTATLETIPVELGLPAPELQIATWVKGTTTTLAEGRGSRLYVVEFWATWCMPCRLTSSHLTRIQAKYKDQGVVVIGITDEEESVVSPFVEKEGAKKDYTVAIDAKQQTAASYMGTYGVRGIPHAFVVDKEGRIAWHGHPMGGLDRALAQMLEGKYDITKANRAAKAYGYVRTYFRLLPTEPEKAKAIGEQILSDAADEPSLLDSFAWRIATISDLKNRDLDLALRAAKNAVDVTKQDDASVLETYARVLFEKGQLQDAVKYQDMALQKNKEEANRPALQAALERYKKAVEQLKSD